MKRFFLLFLILALILPTAALAQGQFLGYKQVVNCDSWVSLRSGPSTSASRLCKIPKGEYVEAYYYNTEFVECYYSEYHGYILSAYLSAGTCGTYGDYLGIKKIVNCNEFVTLRSSASTSASAVTRVAKGQTVEAYYYNSTFSYCIYNNLEGYILNEYLGSTSSSGGSYSCVSSCMEVCNCDSWVSLRKYADTNSERLDYIPKGCIVYDCTSVGYDDTWVYCCFDGTYGYILRKYLKNA